ncbi:MAG: hypothetical protein UZ14_CFX002000722 [Chloroflexi bacterium OLB14]|nr:MAG: hypothetical protein UZ14_CFX002000722 [Chloroflexi bacterium OLB14]
MNSDQLIVKASSKFLKKLSIIFLTILLIVLVACGDSVENTPKEDLKPITLTFTKTSRPTYTFIPSRTPVPSDTPTPTMTINPIYMPWLSTAIVVEGTQKVEIRQTREALEKEISQFIIECDGVTQNAQYGSLSPNKGWISTSCGRHDLLVQNKEATKKWLLEFEDFLHPNLQSPGMPGSVHSVFWDEDNSYLYFSTGIGWSGGGTECFSWDVRTGLYRLNLKNGTWVTLVNPSEYFPGDHIAVSPTGRRYVSDINGILITDTYTGEVTQINATGIMAFRWSPDGTKLAYSTSNCNEEGFVIDSSVSVWDAITNEIRIIFATESEVLTPIQWDNNSVLRFESEKYKDLNTIYTLYVFDIIKDEVLFIGPSSLLP